MKPGDFALSGSGLLAALKVHLIGGARPDFMKIAPLWRALSADPAFAPVIVHTGRPGDPALSGDILIDLRLPPADHHLGVVADSPAALTGGVMVAYDGLLQRDRADWIVVVGDDDPTVAGALTGCRHGVPVVHLEAGLRSRDASLPEEINRRATDAICGVCWTSSGDADANLAAEGVPGERITRVGNIMMDSYELVRPMIRAAGARGRLRLPTRSYGVVTLRWPVNIDDDSRLAALVDALAEAQRRLPLVFVLHPTTRARLESLGHDAVLAAGGVRLEPQLGYTAFMNLIEGAAVAITDSAGIQEETTYLGVPCLTLRDTTARPITIFQGTNRLVGPDTLLEALEEALDGAGVAPPRPDRWDGLTAARCVEDLRVRSGLSHG
jgi:UDP-N-acetylglucosamine 2-epimerase (non-hydrolysing)